MDTYKIFTIEEGKVTEGAVIGKLHLAGAGVDIPAVIVGEEGRGRELGVLPVAGILPTEHCPESGRRFCSSSAVCEKCGEPLTKAGIDEYSYIHPKQGVVLGKLVYAAVGETKAGKPKLIARGGTGGLVLTTDEAVIVVFRTHIGFRGSNEHSGDDFGVWQCVDCDAEGKGSEAPNTCPNCGVRAGMLSGPALVRKPFPGGVLAEGIIAQGDAGRMGSGEQIVAVMPKGVVFRTGYSGRLYGAPAAHYYVWDGQRLISATLKERAAADLF